MDYMLCGHRYMEKADETMSGNENVTVINQNGADNEGDEITEMKKWFTDLAQLDMIAGWNYDGVLTCPSEVASERVIGYGDVYATFKCSDTANGSPRYVNIVGRGLAYSNLVATSEHPLAHSWLHGRLIEITGNSENYARLVSAVVVMLKEV